MRLLRQRGSVLPESNDQLVTNYIKPLPLRESKSKESEKQREWRLFQSPVASLGQTRFSRGQY